MNDMQQTMLREEKELYMIASTCTDNDTLKEMYRKIWSFFDITHSDQDILDLIEHFAWLSEQEQHPRGAILYLNAGIFLIALLHATDGTKT